MSYNFLPYEQDQLYLMPPSVQEWVREESCTRFLSDVVDQLALSGRLSCFYAQYREDGWGAAAFHPGMMVKVLLYGYSNGVVSSRKLAQALEQDVGFRYLAANQTPNFRTLSTFRTAHSEALLALFTESLELCREAGLVKLGRVSLDGTRVQGNCALEQNRTRAKLEKLVAELLASAEATDRAEDAQYGMELRGDELPEKLRSGEKRVEELQAALARLNERRDAMRAEQQEVVDAWKKRSGRGRGRRPTDVEKVDLPEKTTANMTDPESQALSTRRGWVQGYNAQAMAESGTQVIVAQQITQETNDVHQLIPMLARCEEQAGARPEMLVADAGYWSNENADEGDGEMTLLIAVPARPKTATSPPSDQYQEMQAQLGKEENREAYAERKSTIEPVFGQMRTRGLRTFMLRGKRKAGLEWSLWCATHNLLKLWRARNRQTTPAMA
ncbi:transposase [Longimicrobium terrae]|uniref:transposase n=1 Tax=Longimicrobium terrae TaxID=1639882 RepID=UPI0014742FE6|nr:transposase [Longimicrobium terrae]NNC33198.1 transposase [Longimicrobium terrae]